MLSALVLEPVGMALIALVGYLLVREKGLSSCRGWGLWLWGPSGYAIGQEGI